MTNTPLISELSDDELEVKLYLDEYYRTERPLPDINFIHSEQNCMIRKELDTSNEHPFQKMEYPFKLHWFRCTDENGLSVYFHRNTQK